MTAAGGRASELPVALRRGWVGILVAGLLLQVGLAALGLPPAGRPLVGDEHTYVGLAEAWAAGQPAELDPLWPPGHPALLALWIRLVGGWQSYVLVQVAALALAAVTLGRLALRLSGDPRLALIAAALFAIDPQVAAMAQAFWPESLHLAFALLAFELALVSTPRLRTAAALGLVMAGAVLLKSLFTPLVPILLGALLWRASGPVRWRLAAAALAALFVLTAPVIATNYRRHRFLGVADSAGFNLLLGLTEVSPRSLRDDRAGAAYAAYRASGATFQERRGALAERLRRLLDERGIARLLAGQLPRQYFRLFDRESYFAAMLPGGALAAAGGGFQAPPPWLAAVLGGLGLAIHALLLATAPFGFARLLGERRAGVWWALAWLGYVLALFFFLHVKSRYRVVLVPVLDLGAAAALITLFDRPRLGQWRTLPRPLLGTAGLGAIALLVFGFGADLGR